MALREVEEENKGATPACISPTSEESVQRPSVVQRPVQRLPVEGLVAVVKQECPTCALIAPVLGELDRHVPLAVYSQDDAGFPDGVRGVIDDHALEASWRLNIEIVPTLIRIENGREAARLVGWNRDEWRAFTGLRHLGEGLPENRPGCGSRTQEPGVGSRLQVRYGETGLKSREVALDDEADAIEACYDRGWSDGLPVVPPTRERVLDMLAGTRRSPAEVIGLIPPNRVECTIEKIAINAVMAGCKSEFLPVVLAAVEASLIPEFNMHGVLATTNACAPVVMVNGPVAKAIGMNAKGNVFGQGNRANATIGRALQLLVRNVGGGRPGEIDRAVFGNPGKYSFCFAEDEDPHWESHAVTLGYSPKTSTVTLFAGDGVNPVIDHTARTPEELVRSYVGVLIATYNRWQVTEVGAFLVVGHEHAQVFHQAGWSKQRLKRALEDELWIPVKDIVPGRAGLGGLTPEEQSDPERRIPKFRTGQLHIIRAGGSAGKYSAVIAAIGSVSMRPVTVEVKP
jgi:hypothetical protein